MSDNERKLRSFRLKPRYTFLPRFRMKSRVEEIEAYKLQQEINELYNNLQNKIESEKRDMKFIDDVIEKYKQGELTKMV